MLSAQGIGMSEWLPIPNAAAKSFSAVAQFSCPISAKAVLHDLAKATASDTVGSEPQVLTA